jgi:hypothetical protein
MKLRYHPAQDRHRPVDNFLSHTEHEPVHTGSGTMGEVMAELKDLKQLANAVREKGTANATTDPALARRSYVKLEECGAALDQPGALKILQLTAQAIRQMGGAQGARPGR